MEINDVRKFYGLKLIEDKKRKCMRCNKQFNSSGNRICLGCHDYYRSYDVVDDVHHMANNKAFNEQKTQYLYGESI